MSTVQSTGCRSCGGTKFSFILDLGCTPLANALLTIEQLAKPEETYPLHLVFCHKCSLVQITETVPREKLFREYFYFSSVSDTLLCHAQGLAEQLMTARHLDASSLAVEIGSNDGYLLQYYKRAGIQVLGIEPARNVARVAETKQGIPTVCEFFDEKLAARFVAQGRIADVIHANNVLAHVPDLNGFVRGLQLLLKSEGVAVIEVPYVKDMIDCCEFDTIYHEHLSYFSLTALDRLFRSNGLIISNLERHSIHGGTLRIFANHEEYATAQVSDGQTQSLVRSLLDQEADWGVEKSDFYLGFGRQVDRLRDQLLQRLCDLKRDRKRIAAYGASAKGSTLLNCFGIGKETLDFVVDRSPVKQGLVTPGTHLPIYAPEKLLEEMPDYTLLLTWNFADEIFNQQAEYRQRGGRFIIPVPEVQVV